MAGRISDMAVAPITRRINGQIATKENLLPVYEENGVITPMTCG